MTIPLAVDTSRLYAQSRIDLVAALRLAAQFGLHEGVCNHFSLSVPLSDGTSAFLINPQGLQWSEVLPSDLVLVDVNGRKLDGKYHVEPTAFFIHGRIHRAKTGAHCILHTHMPYATALTLLEDGALQWASQNSLRFYNRVAYYSEYGGLALDEAEGDRICDKLADADILFMANHGVIVCAENMAYAFDDLYYLERACMVQVLAMSTGRPLRILSPEIASLTSRQFQGERQQSALHFEALKRMLSVREPDGREPKGMSDSTWLGNVEASC